MEGGGNLYRMYLVPIFGKMGVLSVYDDTMFELPTICIHSRFVSQFRPFIYSCAEKKQAQQYLWCGRWLVVGGVWYTQHARVVIRRAGHF